MRLTHKGAIGAIILAMAIGSAVAQEKGGAKKGPPMPGLTLTSPDFQDGGVIPNKYTQAVPNPMSPKLEWTHVPAGTVTFVLNMLDPDTALGKKTDTVVHWVMFNIPGTATGLPQNVPPDPKLPDGSIQIKNQGGVVGFRGPGAPPQGPPHHYTWELYALDTKLDLGPDATRADVLSAINGHILGKGILMGHFIRPAQ